MTELISRLFTFTGESKGSAILTRKPDSVDTLDPTPPRPRIGLAVSSGAAKGLAHIGVIQVLEENGIEIDAVAGSSMGAYVGSLWAAGYDGIHLEELAATVRSPLHSFQLLDPVFPPRRGFVRGGKVRDRLHASLGYRSFRDLEKDLYVVTTKLENLGRIVISEGPVVDAVHASIAIPGICQPVSIDGVDYTDGGVSDPLPVNVLKRAGIDIVIAVCVMPTEDELNFKRERTLRPEGLRGWFNRHFNYWSEGNLFHIQRSAEFGMQMRLAELSMKEADVRIRPIICDATWHDYSGYEKYIRVGREVTESKIEEIKALISPRQNQDEAP